MSLSTFASNTINKVGNTVKSLVNDVKSKISNIIGNASANFTSLWDGGFAGISKEGIEELKVALNNYVNEIEAHINEFNPLDCLQGAVAGEIREAVFDYATGVKALLSAYVSTMRVNLDDLDAAFNAYISQTNELAEYITSDADDIRAAAKKIDLDTANGIALTMPTFGGSLASKYEPKVTKMDKIGDGIKEFFGLVGDGLNRTAATVGVFTTSVISGAGRLVEKVGDGVTIAAGGIASGIAWLGDKIFGTDNASKIMDSTMDFVRRDLVGEANQKFYEDTKLGQYINDASLMKYDSKLAQGIQTGTETVAKIAVATAATVATGGAAAPLIGLAYGMGQAGQNYAQSVDRENGESYNYAKAGAKIALGGAAGAAEFYAYGKMGSNLYNGYQAIQGTGGTIGEIIANGGGPQAIIQNLKMVDVKSLAVDSLKATVSKESLMEIGLTTSDHVVNLAFGDETLAEFAKNTVSEAALGTVMNFGGAFLGGAAQDVLVPVLDAGASAQAYSKYDSFMGACETFDDAHYGDGATRRLMDNNLDSYNTYVNQRFSDPGVIDDMAERLYTATDGNVPKEQIAASMTGKTSYVRTDAYFEENPNVMGYNNANGSVIKTDGYTPREIESTIIHETTHDISRTQNGWVTGVRVPGDETFGINESITEYYAKLASPTSRSGYDEGTDIISRLVDDGILSKSTLDNAYFNSHNANEITWSIQSQLTPEGQEALIKTGFIPNLGEHNAWNNIALSGDGYDRELGRSLMNDALNIIELYRK